MMLRNGLIRVRRLTNLKSTGQPSKLEVPREGFCIWNPKATGWQSPLFYWEARTCQVIE